MLLLYYSYWLSYQIPDYKEKCNTYTNTTLCIQCETKSEILFCNVLLSNYQEIYEPSIISTWNKIFEKWEM